MPTIGTCSNCNGPVQVPDLWGGTVPPVPTCAHCGATAKDPYGPIMVTMRPIPMEKRPPSRTGARQPPSAPVRVSWADFWIAQGDWPTANDYDALEKAERWLRAQQAAAADEVLAPTGTFCSVCEAPQHNTPSGVSCPRGHGGAEPLAAWPEEQQPAAVDDADRDDARRYRALVATGKYVPAMREGWGLACGHSKASKAELDAAADALAAQHREESKWKT